MSRTLTYPSFLETQDGGFLQTNDVLIDPALRGRLATADRRRFDRIAETITPAGLRRLAARRSGLRAASGLSTGRSRARLREPAPIAGPASR